MSKYDNYSPNIPNTDDSLDVQEQEIEEQPSKPQRRRRNVATTRPMQEETRTKRKKEVENKQKEEKSVAQEPLLDKLKNFFASPALRISVGIILGGLGFWLAVAFMSYLVTCIQDQSLVLSGNSDQLPKAANEAGKGGARLMEILINQGFGIGSLVIVVWLIAMSLKLLVGYPKFRTLDFTMKSIFAMITLSVVVGMLSIGLDTPVNWGGFHGRYINERIYEYIGWTGAFILSIVLVAIFVVICMRDVVKWILKKKHAYDEKRRIQRELEEAEAAKEAEIREMERRERMDQALSGEGLEVKDETQNADESTVSTVDSVDFESESDTLYEMTDDIEEEEDFHKPDESLTADELDLEEEQDAETELAKDDAKEVSENIIEKVQEETAQYNQEEATEGVKEEEKAKEETSNIVPSEVMTVNVNQIAKADDSTALTYDPNLFTHAYKFPPTDYLRPGTDKISVDADEQIENKERIKKTLLDFSIPITSIVATVGPTVTLYEIRPESGVKIAKIKNLQDDIALSLAARGVRIIAPIPGKGTVGIEVANKDPQTVSMRTIIQSKIYQESKYKLPIALGSTISNDVYIADLAKMPHLLVAGATGQGKSVGLNAIITSLLYSKRPEELKFVMVDPKRVEFSLYSKIEKYYLAEIPNCEQPIITNMENVVATLSSLCAEMDERYKLLEKAYVRQVSEYNEKFKSHKLDPREGHRYMPYIVVIIDEFADLIMTAGKEVEIPIARLAQLARAIGIHVIIATQRPSTNVITGMIKANFPVRIAFKVSSGVDSKTILDSTGAQQLIGRGDMLISNNGEMVRVQCAFVDTPEVEEVCDYISRQPYPQGPYILPEPQIGGGDGESNDIDTASLGKKDPLLEEVARQVVMSGTASTSAVQRRYEIGYNRAGRIMDQLQAYGIVGPATGGKPRDVLVDSATLESILASI